MNPHPASVSRRRFLAASSAALGLAPMAWLRAQGTSPNDEILMGSIGCGGMGNGNLRNFLGIPGVRVVAVCDVDARKAAATKAMVDEHYQNQDCKVYGDHHELLGHPGLDVISQATPDHWHARIGIDCAEAGMDVYGEKPFAWGLAEGRALVAALTKRRRVWQTGCWQRSEPYFRRFKALIQNQTLGKITRIECGTPAGWNLGKSPPEAELAAHIGKPPAGLDWHAYCGPVKNFTYHPLIHPWNWRWLNAFGGGQLLDWVGHHLDTALWTLGLDHSGPVKVAGRGAKKPHPLFDTYTEYSYELTFADERVIEVRSDFGGVKMTGENGWIHVDRGRLEASDRELLRNLPADFDTRPPSHWQDFINCVRSRQTTVAPAEPAHRAASIGQLAIVALDTGAPLHWDPQAEKVLGNATQAAHPRLGARLDF
jgi:predicted dehydrogenase